MEKPAQKQRREGSSSTEGARRRTCRTLALRRSLTGLSPVWSTLSPHTLLSQLHFVKSLLRNSRGDWQPIVKLDIVLDCLRSITLLSFLGSPFVSLGSRSQPPPTSIFLVTLYFHLFPSSPRRCRSSAVDVAPFSDLLVHRHPSLLHPFLSHYIIRSPYQHSGLPRFFFHLRGRWSSNGGSESRTVELIVLVSFLVLSPPSFLQNLFCDAHPAGSILLSFLMQRSGNELELSDFQGLLSPSPVSSSTSFPPRLTFAAVASSSNPLRLQRSSRFYHIIEIHSSEGRYSSSFGGIRKWFEADRGRVAISTRNRVSSVFSHERAFILIVYTTGA